MTGRIACGIGNTYITTVLEQVVMNFQRIFQVAPPCLTLSSYTVAASRTEGVSDDDMPRAAIGWWPAAQGFFYTPSGRSTPPTFYVHHHQFDLVTPWGQVLDRCTKYGNSA